MHKIKPLFWAVIFVASGCATFSTGPDVNVMPSPGKSFETFQAEETTCRQWAEQQAGISSEQTYEKNVATGAVAGTAIGAGLGAAAGSASGRAGKGAAVGAAGGLLSGSAAGSGAGQDYAREVQRRYDNAYIQCMYTYGNQLPGYRSRGAVAPPQYRVAVPPPPPNGMAQADISQFDMPSDLPEAFTEPGEYPVPQEVYVDEAPQFIYSPALNMYVAVGVPYDLVYTGSDYFYFYGGRWYRGPYYNGPWVPATRRYIPPGLLKYRIDNIRYYRDLEYRRYDHDRTHFDGRFYRPEFQGERRRRVR